MDVIGMIHPSSTRGHRYILVATDYFTKWVEAVPLFNVDQNAVIKFIKEHIPHRFGIPESIVSDQAQYFVGGDLAAFAKEMGIIMTHSSPYFAQGNGQAESTNKTLKAIIQKMLEENPRAREWHETLSQALRAYRTSQRGSTKATPYSLVYGQDAVLPAEVTVQPLRTGTQHQIDTVEYRQSMLARLEQVELDREAAREAILDDKQKVIKKYNKHVRIKKFVVGMEGDVAARA